MIFDKPFTDPKAVIKIDSRENKRIQPVREFFGYENTTVAQLPTGDFIYDDKVCIEYKNVKTDLFSSLINKRLFRQVARMVQEFPIHYVLIQGDPIKHILKNRSKYRKEHPRYLHFTTDQWDGAYTSLQQVTQVVFVYNFQHAIQIMNLLFKKSTDNKNRVYHYMEKFPNVAMTFLSCQLGIGEKTAKLVCDELGLDNWKDLDRVKREQLVNITGIKNKKADLIMEAIGDS